MDTYTLRELTADDFPAVVDLLGRAFLIEYDSGAIAEKDASLFGSSRNLGAFDGGRLVGNLRVLPREVSVPGRGLVPFDGISMVVVASDHRRRGLLNRLMRETLTEAGTPLAGLWASEAQIYGRFGFGTASEATEFEVPAGAAFRPEIAPDVSSVRELPRDEAMAAVRETYARFAERTPGVLGREGAHWDAHYFEAGKPGVNPRRFAVHPDGYATFRTTVNWGDRGPDGLLELHELVALTPDAYAGLWRYALDVDLVGTVTALGATDELLPLLLANPRAAVRKTHHALHVRLTRVPEALALRTYAADADVVVELADEFCPWNAGRWRLGISGGEATVAATTDPADLSTSSTELGAAFLGGTRLAALAAAGRVQEHTPGAVTVLSRAFQGDRDPFCGEVF